MAPSRPSSASFSSTSRFARGLTLLCLFGRFVKGVTGAGIADVCWETIFDLPEEGMPCDNAIGQFAPFDPPNTIPMPDNLSYLPTCFKDDVTTATAVTEDEKHPVRCISDSQQIGYAYCSEHLTFQEAVDFCANFRGDPAKAETMNMAVYDFRLPETPMEAGRVCGSGCSYDFDEIWVGFGATAAPTTMFPTMNPTSVSPTWSPTTKPPTESPTSIAPTVSPTAPTSSPTSTSPTINSASVTVSGVADVCWETEFVPCDNSNGRFAPYDPPETMPDNLGYIPTCFRDDITTAVLADPSEKHPVRCISDSLQIGYSYCVEHLTFQEALAFCANFRGDPSRIETMNLAVYDFRLPQTPMEAGRVCGSGCAYDFDEIWVGFGNDLSGSTRSPTTISPTSVAPTSTGVPGAGIADVCWETEFHFPPEAPCDNANGRFAPFDPPTTIPMPDNLSYIPTCFKDDVNTATITPVDERHPVRCISDSLQIGYAYCAEHLTYQEALDFCANFRGDENKPETMNLAVYDFRLPQTPMEAGRLCGSGCSYDFDEIWVGFGDLTATTGSPTASPATGYPPEEEEESDVDYEFDSDHGHQHGHHLHKRITSVVNKTKEVKRTYNRARKVDVFQHAHDHDHHRHHDK